ncbi:MAG: hypothetical protein NZ561_08400 [Phycisphaerae bacterium]|nr:hypothetical protein [Phycisphaerae bacterium]MDW8261053.1 hypothetical protein [Phycisphaerales bacterium]
MNSIRRRFVSAFALAALVGWVAFHATARRAGADEASALPSAKEVIDRYVSLTGGRELFSSITSRKSTGTFEVPAAQMKGSLTVLQALPDLSLVTIDVPGIGQILRGSNAGVFWEISPMTGARILDEGEAEEARRQILFEADLNWEKYFESAETVGVQSVEGRPAYKVKLVAAADGKVSHFYYDKETGLLVRTDTEVKLQGNSLPVTTYLGDYKDFNGVKLATTVRMELAGMEQVIRIESDEHNVKIDPQTFELPADIKALQARLMPGK